MLRALYASWKSLEFICDRGHSWAISIEMTGINVEFWKDLVVLRMDCMWAILHPWAWPNIIKTEVDQELCVSLSPNFKALLLTLLWSCFCFFKSLLPIKLLDY